MFSFSSAPQPTKAPDVMMTPFGMQSTQAPGSIFQPSTICVPAGYPLNRLSITPESLVISAREAWDPNSPNCQFKHYFYNIVHPSTIQQYGPNSKDDEKLYEHAVKNNPDPTRMVPVLAVGFGDLQKRMREQERYMKNMMYRLGEIAIACDLLKDRHEDTNRARLTELRRKHQELAARVLRIMIHIHVLRCKNLPLTADEADLCSNFDELAARLRRPDEFMGQMSTLWRDLSSFSHIPAKADFRGNLSANLAADNIISADTDDLRKVLFRQQEGICHVVDVVKSDQHDLVLMEKAYKKEKESIYRKVLFDS